MEHILDLPAINICFLDGDLLQVPVKKHKKHHKHKKHKRQKADSEIDRTTNILKMPVLNPSEEDVDVFR